MLYGAKSSCKNIIECYNTIMFNIRTNNITKLINSVEKSKQLTLKMVKELKKKNRNVDLTNQIKNEDNPLDPSTWKVKIHIK